MLDRLIDFAVHRRAVALLLSLAFAAFGVYTFTKLKVEAFPDVTNVQVMVITLYPGQAAEEVEKKVTIPVERALTGTPRVLVQRSITSFGLSQVIMTFQDDVDIYWARQQVVERLPDAEVPAGVEPSLGPNDTPVGQIYPVHAGERPPQPQRAAVSGRSGWSRSTCAASTASRTSSASAASSRSITSSSTRRSLRNTGLSLKDVGDAIEQSNGSTSGGYLKRGESRVRGARARIPEDARGHREHRHPSATTGRP